jgi:glycosyltransferase involved in cell wall biosynthesis
VADIDLLVFDSRARTATRLVLAEGFTQTVFPAEPEYRAAEHVLNVGVDWVPISDSAFPLLAALAGSFRAACAQICAGCQLIVLEQPYLSAALPDGPTPVIYDAQNMEAALKHRLYPSSVAGRRMLDLVVSTEHAACTRAAEIWACSPADANQLSATYRIPPERFLPVPNGIDPQRILFVPPGARAQRRRQYGTLGGDGELAYFVGSWHGPNIDAARRVIRAAAAFPDMRFVIGGGVCRALLAAGAESPDNVTLAGALDEAENLAWLTTCDIALNPMQDGSGSNLKMFEYCAAGAPVATTAIGMRATDLRDETHVRQAPFETFEDAIIATRADSLAVREQRSRAARRHVVRHFDWDVIVARLLRDSRMLAGLLAQPPAGRRRRA